MLVLPKLAKCTNRLDLAAEHPVFGDPTSWFSSDVQTVVGIIGLSFDFFVNWQTRTLSNEIWLKRIVQIQNDTWPPSGYSGLRSMIDDVDGPDMLKHVGSFGAVQSLTPKYMLFKDSVDWSDPTNSIWSATVSADASLKEGKKSTLDEIKARIRLLSGGPIRIGSKGLIYGTSSLECFLSHTDALWPGDVDLLLLGQDYKPIAIVEYKKHTRSSKTTLQQQTLSLYYPNPDGRKYDRLAILRDKVAPGVPIIILYYSTLEAEQNVIAEVIGGPVGKLVADRNRRGQYPTPRPDDESAKENLLRALLAL